jgi:hypothetical protein
VNRFQNIDWTRLYKVLLVQAAGILRRYGGPDTFDGGQNCEDIVAEVLKDFYKSPNGLGWKESKGEARNLSLRRRSQQTRGPPAPSEARGRLAR